MPAQSKTITIETVKGLRPGEIVWDTRVLGLGIRRQKSEARTYIVKARVKNQQRWFTIGRHGSPWTPATARKEAIRILGDIANGQDLAAVRNEEKNSITINELCDMYIMEARAGNILTKFGTPKKKSTLDTDTGRISRHIKPLLGQRRVKDVTSQDIKRFLTDVAIGKTAADIKTGLHGRAIVRGGKGTATRTVGLLGGIFSYAIDKGLRPDNINPVQGVKKYPYKKEMRFLTTTEFGKLGDAMNAMAKDGVNAYALAGIRLLMLTGCRKSEILSLKWAHVDFENGCLRLPDSKTGSRVILLGTPVIKLLQELQPTTGNPYVLPGQKEGTHLIGIPKIWNEVRRRAEIEWATLHILRHSFASLGAGFGLGLPIIGHLLGHKDASTTNRYAKVAFDPAKLAADLISKGVAAAVDGSKGEIK